MPSTKGRNLYAARLVHTRVMTRSLTRVRLLVTVQTDAMLLGKLDDGRARQLAGSKETGLPAIHRADGDAQLVGEFFLGETQPAPQTSYEFPHMIFHVPFQPPTGQVRSGRSKRYATRSFMACGLV